VAAVLRHRDLPHTDEGTLSPRRDLEHRRRPVREDGGAARCHVRLGGDGEQARAYKPSLAPFRLAFEAIGAPPDRILHVAQSICHDVVPARELGLAVVRVDRRGDREGFGATPPAEAKLDLEVPDLATLVTRMGVK
jgi:hypothetical protein